MRIYRIVASFALCVSLLASAGAVAGASNTPETVTVVNYDPSRTIWTRGSLAIITKKDGSLVLGLDFAMPKGLLESMTLHGSGWVVDVSGVVSSLTSPYPLRAQAYIEKMSESGDLIEFSVVLPFGEEGKLCQEMSLHVVNGRLIEHTVSRAADVQCEP